MRARLADPDPGWIRRFREHGWTAHNVALSATERTLGEREVPLIGDDPRTRTILDTLHLTVSRNGSLAGLRLLDLGCLEGGLSLEMARRDMEVLGVEGRASNFEKCRLVEGYFELPNLRFLHLDVRRLDPEEHGRFDVVLCCGLLYHLADPFSFIAQLRRLTADDGVLFLDTHVAPANDEALARCRLREQLSELERWPAAGVELEGRWSREFLTPLGKDEPWDSIAESRSFWPTREALFECLYRNRFDYVADLHGTFDPAAERVLRREFSRIYCVATRRGRESPRRA